MSSSVTATDVLAQITGPIVLAGAGKMGGAMLTGWLARGLDPAHVAVIEPFPSEEIRALLAKGVRLNPKPKDVGGAATLVVALKPQMFREAGPDLKPFAGPSTLVVSIMAGTTIASIREVCGGSVVRAMPNTPAAIGRGITVAVAANDVSTAQRAVADALLRATGSVEWVDDENLMDAVTAVSGSGPAGELLHRSDQPSATLRQNVTSPGGTTAAALAVLMAEDGMQPLMIRAVAAATRRSKELAK